MFKFLLIVPIKVRSVFYGERYLCFNRSSAILWNNLPTDIKDSDTVVVLIARFYILNMNDRFIVYLSDLYRLIYRATFIFFDVCYYAL